MNTAHSVAFALLHVITFGLLPRAERQPEPRQDDRITTAEREDTRARYFAACANLERAAEECERTSNATMELHRE